MYSFLVRKIIFRKAQLNAWRRDMRGKGWNCPFNTSTAELVDTSEVLTVKEAKDNLKHLEEMCETKISIYIRQNEYYFVNGHNILLYQGFIDHNSIGLTLNTDLAIHFPSTFFMVALIHGKDDVVKRLLSESSSTKDIFKCMIFGNLIAMKTGNRYKRVS